MNWSSRVEALGVIGFGGCSMGGILLFGGATPEIRMSGFVTFAASLVVLLSTICLQFAVENPQRDRALPWWNNIGLFLVGAGFSLLGYPVIGISVVLTGMAISLAALHYRERMMSDSTRSE